MAKETEKGKYRRVVLPVVLCVVRFVLLSLGCILASAASSVFLPNIEIPRRYAPESFNLSGYIGMVAFVEAVGAVEGFRGRWKSVWLECMAALAFAMLITFPIWWTRWID